MSKGVVDLGINEDTVFMCRGLYSKLLKPYSHKKDVHLVSWKIVILLELKYKQMLYKMCKMYQLHDAVLLIEI